jgi:hypothetical protein
LTEGRSHDSIKHHLRKSHGDTLNEMRKQFEAAG